MSKKKIHNEYEERQRAEIAIVSQYRSVFKKRRDILNANADRLLDRQEVDPLFDVGGVDTTSKKT